MSVFDGLKLPEVVYETSSKYNDSIQVIKVNDVYKLSVDNFIQSLSKNSKAAPRLCWGETIKILKEEMKEEEVRNILVLGLGGGTMQHMLREEYPDAHIVSVEIDPVMVDIARKYFDLDSIQNHEIIVEDAFRFVIEPEENNIRPQSFDIIIVDIVFGDSFSDLGASGNFLGALKKLAVPGNIVLFNRMYLDEYQESVNTFIEYVGNFFDDVDTHIVAGYTNSDNILIYGRA